MKSTFHFTCFGVLLALIFGTSTGANAQSNPDRWNTDGNLGDTTKFLGTTDSEPVLFRTDNQERMRITANGRVGINVKKPQARLDVKGTAQFRNDLLLPGLPPLSYPFSDSYGLLLNDSAGATFRVSYADLLKKLTIGGYQAPTFPPNPVDICELAGFMDNPVWYNGPYKIFTAPCPQLRVGINTTDPQETLDVRGTGYFSKGIRLGTDHTGLNFPAYLEGYRPLGEANPWIRMMVHANGTDHTVFVVSNEGGIYCTSARVRVKEDIPIPDFVFHEDYKLMPLSEVKSYVEEHAHLPGIPSEAEIRTEGLSLEEMQLQLLQKVEELTLYMIELKEENTLLKSEVELLKIAKQ